MTPNGLAPAEMTLQGAQDRMALQHLVQAYCHAVDRQDYGLLRTLYHDDAIDDHTPYFCGNAAAYIDWLPSMLAQWAATTHTVFTPIFCLQGDVAQGEVAARAWHLTLDRQRQFVAWGRYADHYTRRDGIWRFSRRAFILDWSEERPVVAGDDFGATGVAVGRSGSDDPVYGKLSFFAAGRSAAVAGDP